MDHGATAIIRPSRQDWLFALQEINDASLNTYLVMVVTRVLKHTFFFLFPFQDYECFDSLFNENREILPT